MIYGETTHTDGRPILNTRWPQRGLFHVLGYSENGAEIDVYVWDDNEGDAIESAQEWVGDEGGDDSNINVYRVGVADRKAIKRVTDAFNDQPMTGLSSGLSGAPFGFTKVGRRY